MLIKLLNIDKIQIMYLLYIFIKQMVKFIYNFIDVKSAAFVPEMDKWTNQFRGVFRIGAVDCDEYPALCQKEGIT